MRDLMMELRLPVWSKEDRASSASPTGQCFASSLDRLLTKMIRKKKAT